MNSLACSGCSPKIIKHDRVQIKIDNGCLMEIYLGDCTRLFGVELLLFADDALVVGVLVLMFAKDGLLLVAVAGLPANNCAVQDVGTPLYFLGGTIRLGDCRYLASAIVLLSQHKIFLSSVFLTIQ